MLNDSFCAVILTDSLKTCWVGVRAPAGLEDEKVCMPTLAKNRKQVK